MATLSESSAFESLFQSALEEYEKVTGINLVRHPLAAQLERCNSVESVTQAIQDQAEAFCKFREGNHEAITVLKHTVRALHALSAIDLVCRKSFVDPEAVASDISSTAYSRRGNDQYLYRSPPWRMYLFSCDWQVVVTFEYIGE